MIHQIDSVAEWEYPAVVSVWEASVRATHHFLTEEAIQFYKPLILNDYLKAVDLACVRDGQGQLVGFLGVADHKIEMLFIHPAMRGKGVGRALIHYALNSLKATAVDVNEDNAQAVGFYEHLGFRTTSRSALDPMSKPFPILHMKRENA